jgi:hypothetical protein
MVAMLITVWVVRRMQSGGFILPSNKLRLYAMQSLTFARSIATAFFAQASHVPMY